MRRGRKAQLVRLTMRRTAGEDAAAGHTAMLRARVEIGTAVRRVLAQAGIDPATLAMLRVVDEAARELALCPEPPAAAAAPPDGDQPPDGSAALFEMRIAGLVRRYRQGQVIEFAKASLGEALAWCLANLE